MRKGGRCRVLTSAILFMLVPARAQASWLSKITGIHIDPVAGHFSVSAPQPQAIPEMLQNLPKDAAQFFLNPAGTALAQAIRVSHAQASPGAQPIPPFIRQQLAPFFPQAVLDRARFNTNRSALSLQGVVHLIDSNYAITLDDIIVFPNGQAASDPVLWAHELTHVSQYANMGIDSFASVYSATGGHDLEKQAYDWEAHVQQALQSGGPALPPQAQVDLGSGAFQQPLSAQDFQTAATSLVNPNLCAQWHQIPNGVFVQDVCVVPLMMTAFTIMTPYGPQGVPCNGPCAIMPGNAAPFTGAIAGPVVGVSFGFLP